VNEILFNLSGASVGRCHSESDQLHKIASSTGTDAEDMDK